MCVKRGGDVKGKEPGASGGGDRAGANDINEHGVIVGSAEHPDGTYHAVMWVIRR